MATIDIKELEKQPEIKRYKTLKRIAVRRENCILWVVVLMALGMLFIGMALGMMLLEGAVLGPEQDADTGYIVSPAEKQGLGVWTAFVLLMGLGSVVMGYIVMTLAPSKEETELGLEEAQKRLQTEKEGYWG